MPRYLVERCLTDPDQQPPFEAIDYRGVQEANLRAQVTWLHSYLSTDRRLLVCLYEAESPEAVRHAAALSHLPVDHITEVEVVDPFGYHAGA